MPKITVNVTKKDGDPLTPGAEEPGTVYVDNDTRVVLTAAADSGVLSKVTWKRGTSEISSDTEGEGVRFGEDENKTLEFTAVGQHFDTYTAGGEIDNVTVAVADEGKVKITKITPSGLSGAPAIDDRSRVVDVAIGEFDPWFTRIGAIFTFLVVVGLGYAAKELIQDVAVPLESAVLRDVDVPNGTFAERSAGRIQMLSAALGGMLLAVGAFLAALETRGRLTARVTQKGGPSEGEERGLLAPEAGDALAKVLAELRTVRGTIAALAVGAVLLCGSLWASASTATSDSMPALTGGTGPAGGTGPTGATGPG